MAIALGFSDVEKSQVQTIPHQRTERYRSMMQGMKCINCLVLPWSSPDDTVGTKRYPKFDKYLCCLHWVHEPAVAEGADT